MRRSRNILLLGLMAVGIKAQAQDTAAIRLVQTIPLPKVEGRIGHICR
jgi:hypothetical protein